MGHKTNSTQNCSKSLFEQREKIEKVSITAITKITNEKLNELKQNPTIYSNPNK